MNLVGVTVLKTAYAFDTETGTVTVTFSDPTGATVYGTIVVETEKHRALADALATIAKNYVPDSDSEAARFRLLMDINQNVATTTFS